MKPMRAPVGANEANERAITASDDEHRDRAKPAPIIRANAPAAGSPDSNDDTGHSTCATVDAATPPSKNGKIRPNDRPVAANTPERSGRASRTRARSNHASPPVIGVRQALLAQRAWRNDQHRQADREGDDDGEANARGDERP